MFNRIKNKIRILNPIKNVILYDIATDIGKIGSWIGIFVIICFFSIKIFADLLTVLEKAIQGIIPEAKYNPQLYVEGNPGIFADITFEKINV